MQIISATNARNNFFEILSQAAMQNLTYAIHKRGQAIAYLSSIKPTERKPSILDCAGLWGKLQPKDTKQIAKIYQARKLESPSRVLPKL